MKKQELIRLYGLLAEIHTQIKAWEDEEISLAEYNELGVRPISIHKSKTDHKAVVLKLTKGITGAMCEVEPELLAPQADRTEERNVFSFTTLHPRATALCPPV